MGEPRGMGPEESRPVRRRGLQEEPQAPGLGCGRIRLGEGPGDITQSNLYRGFLLCVAMLLTLPPWALADDGSAHARCPGGA